jgi:D-alanyl-D-alanine carboxypeptidase
MPNMPRNPTPAPDDSLGWRPRPQAPTQSYTSFRELREQTRAHQAVQQTSQHDAANATASAPNPRVSTVTPPPMPAVSAPVERKGWGPFRRSVPAQPKAGRGQVIITDPLLTAVHIPPEANKPDKGWGPTTQQRISAVITGIVGIVAVLALLARPWLDAHAKNGGAIPSGLGILNAQPTAQPYAPVALDTDHPPPVVWAQAAFVMDESNGAVLFAKNPYQELPMASTTKLMTAVVAITHGNLDQTITINADAANTFCTCVGLKVGEKYTLRELLTGMLMISGNDAAEAIADGVAGNVQTFVSWMNQTAVAMGLAHTHYTNPHGLDDNGHYSCARDMAVLGRYALSVPILQQILSTRYATLPATATHAKHYLINQHQPLWWYPGADGGKPGWTPAAQFVDILSAVRNGHHLIATLLHGENDWVTDIRDLLNWGFDDFTWVSPLQVLQHNYIPFAAAYYNFVWDIPSRVLTVNGQEYFPYTGYILSGAFLTYFDAKGGLNAFGFPRGMPLPAANGTLSQRFDKTTIVCNPATGACYTA